MLKNTLCIIKLYLDSVFCLFSPLLLVRMGELAGPLYLFLIYLSSSSSLSSLFTSALLAADKGTSLHLSVFWSFKLRTNLEPQLLHWTDILRVFWSFEQTWSLTYWADILRVFWSFKLGTNLEPDLLSWYPQLFWSFKLRTNLEPDLLSWYPHGFLKLQAWNKLGAWVKTGNQPYL